jgi:hypothetical protein
MKLFLNDLTKYDWLKNKLDQKKSLLLQVGQGKTFVFYYSYIEETSSIFVHNQEIRYVINEDVYRTLARSNGSHVAFLQEPFESNNYLFYAYLGNVIRPEPNDPPDEYDRLKRKLKDIFIEYKNIDVENAKTKSVGYIKGIFEINSKYSCLEALDEIFELNKKPISGFRVLFDMFDEYYKRTKNVSFYGNVLSSFVRLVKNPNGGVINQENGTIRYLIIGEKAAGNDAMLKLAKEQLRQGLDVPTIYLNTSWYYNKYDEKWRKRIDDDEFKFREENIIKDAQHSYSILKDEGYNGGQVQLMNDIVSFNRNAISLSHLIRNNYTRRVNDLVEHSEVFKYYPKLKDVFAIYIQSQNIQNSFYFSSSVPYRIALMSQSVPQNKIPYIALHEIQHYIQEIEGFSNGGNLYLANLISSGGGESARVFINSINALIQRVRIVNINIDITRLEYDLNVLLRGVMDMQYLGAVGELIDYLKDKEVLINSSDIFALKLLQLYSFTQGNKASIKSFISRNYGDSYILVFEENLKKSQEILRNNQSLVNKGWSSRDIYMLNFQTYEAIFGEVESRFVQNTAHIEKELSNYFSFYTSESILPQNITVLNEMPLQDATQKIKAAIEYANGHYIIHLPDEYSNSVNILHELGHIIFDILVESKNLLNEQSKYEEDVKKAKYDSFEEYVCDSFVDFIHRKKIDEGLYEDLNEESTIKNYDKFDYYFNSILFDNEVVIDEVGFNDRITFMNFINSI